MSSAVLDFLETGSRLTLYICCFVYIFPVLEYQIPGTGFLYLLQILLHLTRLFNLAILLLNIPLTTYSPFGDTVLSENSFLTKLTGFRSHVTIPLLALSMLTITREEDVDFVFSNVNQTVSFNLTAYLEGSLDFFNEGVEFTDDLDRLVQPLFEHAQAGFLGASLIFTLTGMTARTEVTRETNEPNEIGWNFRLERPRLRARSPTQGAATRSGSVALLAGLAFVLGLVDSGSGSGPLLLLVGELIYAALLVVVSLWRVILNLRGEYTPASLVDVYLAIQLNLYVAVTSPTLSSFSSDLPIYYGIGGFAVVGGAWALSYNVRLPRVIQSSLGDARRLARQNLRKPGVIFRILQAVAISAGILALMFAYYSFIGNAFEFEFSSGDAVVLVQGVVDDVESTFDGVIVDINSFIGAITPCATTSDFWLNATSLGGATVSAADALNQLRDNSYFDECFDSNDEFARPPLNVDLCEGIIENYDDLVAEEAQISGLSPPSGISVDTDFVDDEGNTLENEVFQVLSIDPECNEKLCIAFTVLTVGLFAATLIPFVNIGAAVASKAARVAWRISRIGAKMLKYVRKIYAKRAKLRRFTTLVSKLAATGKPILKFDSVIFFLFVPMITVGLLCLLLGFFRREGGPSKGLKSSTRFRIVVFFIALTLLNLALFFGLFGLDGENSRRYVQSILDNLPRAVIRSTVQYGAGMLYLRLSLLISAASSAAMATSLGFVQVSEYVQLLAIGATASTASTTSQAKRPLNYAILIMLLIVPVSYMALISYGRPEIRWFRLNALQDDRTADIAEQIASSEVVANSVDVINEDLSEEERACGFIAAAVEVVYDGILATLSAVVEPLLGSLRALQETAGELLGQVRVGTFFAPINLNLPQTDQSEFWIVFTLPLLAVVLAVLAISLDLTNRFTGSKIAVSAIERTKGAVTALGMVSFQLNVVIYAVFSALNNLDVPLFNIQLQLGDMLIFALYSSIFCTTAGAALYLDSFLLTG